MSFSGRATAYRVCPFVEGAPFLVVSKGHHTRKKRKNKVPTPHAFPPLPPRQETMTSGSATRPCREPRGHGRHGQVAALLGMVGIVTRLSYPIDVTIGVLFGCFGGKINGPDLPGGLIIYQGHLFALKGHLWI